MPIFQKSILDSYKQDEQKVAARFAEYQDYKAKSDKIKEFKEEEYQDGFLKDIFENCLGYTLKTNNPNNYNLSREKKNETDGKKADGAIFVNGEVIGVIELKDCKTKNLDLIEPQAFNYHNSHKNSKYIIISNFDELRFYIDKKTAYEKFSLFNLTYDDFKKLHLILSYESIKDNLPTALKEKSNSFEAEITNNLYKDYKALRGVLFENLCKNNETIEKTELLKATQKLLDRLVFIFFAEDSGLIPANSIAKIIEIYNKNWTCQPLYNYYKIYFTAIDKGNERTGIRLGYNGELFKPNEFLDALKIDDFVLNEFALKISNYNFKSDVSVNILGHIFENSLSELEELMADIQNAAFDSKKSKRKKDGVFYTPEYITRYIADNTLGVLCSDYKANNKLETKEDLDAYRKWLLCLKILDPACGSGAFLNQALEFLIKEHNALNALYHDVAQKSKKKATLLDYDYEDAFILQNNLYGVDINEEAVEIAKLSLWLRTAQCGQKLVNLSDKIICANSLLDMPFELSSFDVVIGNPPYVRQEAIKDIKPLLEEKYQVYSGTADLYVYFYELGYKLLKNSGLLGFICSNKFFAAIYGEKLRELILTKTTIKTVTNFGDKKVFEDATVTSDITIFQKQLPNEDTTFKIVDVDLLSFYEIKQNQINKIGFVFLPENANNLKSKIEQHGTILKNWDITIRSGIKTGFNEAFIIDKYKRDELIRQDSKNAEIIKPYLRGRDIKRYGFDFEEKYLINTHNNPPINIEEYQSIKLHLDTYKNALENRADKGETFYHLRNCAFLDDFEKDKILWIELSDNGKFTLDTNKYYVDMTIFFIVGNNLKYLLAVLNSKLINWYFNLICAESGVGTNRWKKVYVEQIPIPKISQEEQKPFIDSVDTILEAKQKIKDYKILLDEAVKQNSFDREIALKKELDNLENMVLSSENRIDEMVYKLYGLNDDEIGIVG